MCERRARAPGSFDLRVLQKFVTFSELGKFDRHGGNPPSNSALLPDSEGVTISAFPLSALSLRPPHAPLGETLDRTKLRVDTIECQNRHRRPNLFICKPYGSRVRRGNWREGSGEQKKGLVATTARVFPIGARRDFSRMIQLFECDDCLPQFVRERRTHYCRIASPGVARSRFRREPEIAKSAELVAVQRTATPQYVIDSPTARRELRSPFDAPQARTHHVSIFRPAEITGVYGQIEEALSEQPCVEIRFLVELFNLHARVA